ncbi:hypothetical protein B277_09537 [Janibacter hoylei PVAS-1]|uniref:Uncharacterized protein n=1 Tax=Janibacter hoylei PVAS-1 TaxID=1210046 RepID=K1EPD0_9MICO|nr:hypothetical protein B277_09537 [Janibacter hoylei PVAS-1]
MSTDSTSAPSCRRHTDFRVAPRSAVIVRTGVSRRGSIAVTSSSRAVLGRSLICPGSSVWWVK